MDSFNHIKSYGIVLFTIVENMDGTKKPLYLLYQRRDTYGYMDFMRGYWNEYNIRNILSLMTRVELTRLKTYCFDDLWNDLWTTPNCRIFREGYSKSKRKFESIQERLPDIIDEIEPTVTRNSWGFPKGKKNFEQEPEITAAIREFREETRFVNEKIDLIGPDVWFSEHYTGTDGKRYYTKYFVARCDKPYKVRYMSLPHSNIRNFSVSEEAERVNWFTFERTIDYLSDSAVRQDILSEIHKKVVTLL